MVSKNSSFGAVVGELIIKQMVSKKRFLRGNGDYQEARVVSYAPGLASGSFLVITPASKELLFETASGV